MRTAVLALCGIVLAPVARVESGRLVCSFETPAEVRGIRSAGQLRNRGKRAARGGACYRGRYALEARFAGYAHP